jgi:hypothetical protein
MKILAIIGLSLLILLIGFQIYLFMKQEGGLSETLTDAQNRLAKAQSDGANLSAEVQYLANPLNLEKQLRAQFNYKKPGETMIVIVPKASSTNN